MKTNKAHFKKTKTWHKSQTNLQFNPEVFNRNYQNMEFTIGSAIQAVRQDASNGLLHIQVPFQKIASHGKECHWVAAMQGTNHELHLIKIGIQPRAEILKRISTLVAI